MPAATARAQAAAQNGDITGAIAAQVEAVALVRAAVAAQSEAHELLVTLSVLLYNLANYYAQADRHDDAVRALEEVVALDERTAHPDLATDREALARVRQMADGQQRGTEGTEGTDGQRMGTEGAEGTDGTEGAPTATPTATVIASDAAFHATPTTLPASAENDA